MKNYITFRTTPASNGQPRWAVQQNDGLVLGFIYREGNYYVGNIVKSRIVVGAPRLQQTAALVYTEATKEG